MTTPKNTAKWTEAVQRAKTLYAQDANALAFINTMQNVPCRYLAQLCRDAQINPPAKLLAYEAKAAKRATRQK